jgi:hypothetical protein
MEDCHFILKGMVIALRANIFNFCLFLAACCGVLQISAHGVPGRRVLKPVPAYEALPHGK